MRWWLLAAMTVCAASVAGSIASTARPGSGPAGTIVYAQEDASGLPHIFIASVDGSGVKPLTWDTGNPRKPHVTSYDTEPAISPDGTRVAFNRQAIYCRPYATPPCEWRKPTRPRRRRPACASST